MTKTDWKEKLDELIEGEVDSWISVDKKGDEFIDEMGIGWLKKYLKKDVALWIEERLSSLDKK